MTDSTEEPAPVERIHRMFRHHDTPPQDVVSPLYRELTQDWAYLHSRPNTAIKVGRWGRVEASLAGFTRPGDIVDAIDASTNQRKNELLLALIRLFQSGQQLAGRIVLQALLPKLAKISTHANSCTSSADTWAEDRRHITLADFWEVMADYPVDRRPTSVASNLALDTLHRISGVRRPPQPIPVDPHDFRDFAEPGAPWRDAAPRTWLAGLNSVDADSDQELPNDADLLQVITWALTTSVITQAEAQLLATSYLPQQTTGFGFSDAAQQLGLTQTAVRQRCSRAARKLTDAVRAEIHTAPILSPGTGAQVA